MSITTSSYLNHSLPEHRWGLFKKLYKLEAEMICDSQFSLSLVHFFLFFLFFAKPPSCSCEHRPTHWVLLC